MKNLSLTNCLLPFLVSLLILVDIRQVWGQAAAEPTSQETSKTQEQAPTNETPTSYSLAEVANQALQLNNQLQIFSSNNTWSKYFDSLDQQFTPLQDLNRERAIATHAVLASSMGLEALQSELTYWKEVHRQLFDWNKEAGRLLTEFKSQQARLAEVEEPWKQTQKQATRDGAQPEILERISHVIQTLTETQEAIDQRLRKTSSWQEKLAAEEIITSDILKTIENAQGETLRELFHKDSPELWNLAFIEQNRALFLEKGRGSLGKQISELQFYLSSHPSSIWIQILLPILLYLLLRFMSTHVPIWSKSDPGITEAAKIFAMPKSTALLLSLLLSINISSTAPPLFWVIWGGITLAPTVYVIHKITERPLWHLLRALVAFYLCELLLGITIHMPLFAHLLFLAELVGGVLFCIWFLRNRSHDILKSNFLGQIVIFSVKLSLFILSIALIANIFGYGSFSYYLADGLLRSAIAALCLKAFLTIIHAIFSGLLHLPPLNLLRAIKRNRPLVRDHARKIFQFLAIVYWLKLTLDALSLKNDVVKQVSAWINTPIPLGDTHINIGAIFSFFIAILAALYLSRFIRFLLEEDLYPRIRLARGVPYAISTVLHYLILFVGFILAVAALGYDMTKFTILAGAFGVGLGFGMQNIVNNFVSGLIVLFERPLQIGDVVQIDSVSGTVARIGIRATVIRVGDGSEVVVPNGKLIADRFTNWTLSDRKKKISILISVSNQVNPEVVMKILMDCAKENSSISNLPSPQAFLIEFITNSAGVPGMKLELSAWTNNLDDSKKIQSDLALTIQQALNQMNIPLC